MSGARDPLDEPLTSWTPREHVGEAFRLMDATPVTGPDGREYAYEVLRTECQLQAIAHLLAALVIVSGGTS